MEDSLKQVVGDWLAGVKAPFSLKECLAGIGVGEGDRSRSIETRVGRLLREHGCDRIEFRLAKKTDRRRLYLPPGMTRLEAVLHGDVE